MLSPETMRDLERVFEFAFKALNPFPGYLKPEPHLVTGPFFLGETEITPLPVPHGNSTVNGYLFARQGRKLVAYLSDCSGVPEEISSKDRRRGSAHHRCFATQTTSDTSQCRSGIGGGGSC